MLLSVGPIAAKSNAGDFFNRYKVAAKQSEKNWKVASVFTGDTTPAFAYAATAGVGGKAELKEGPDTDRYSIITPALGRP